MKSYESNAPVLSLVFTILAAAALLYLIPVAVTAEQIPSSVTRNIKDAQWTFFMRQVDVFNGIWLRVNAAGQVFSSTTYVRNLTRVPDQPSGSEKVLLTLQYDNPAWPSDGVTRKQYVYENGHPPIFGRRLYANGTLAKISATGSMFYPTRWGVWPSMNAGVMLPLFAVEKFLRHPVLASHRVTILPIYLGGRYSHVTYARELAGKPYPGAHYSKSKAAKRVINRSHAALSGTFAVVKQCIDTHRSYTRKLSFVRNVASLPAGPSRIALNLADGISVSFPRRVGPSLLGSRTVLYMQWDLRGEEVVRAWTVYREDGTLSHDCTATYYRVAL